MSSAACPQSREGVWALTLSIVVAGLAVLALLWAVRKAIPVDIVGIIVSFCQVRTPAPSPWTMPRLCLTLPALQIVASANTSIKIEWPDSFTMFANTMKVCVACGLVQPQPPGVCTHARALALRWHCWMCSRSLALAAPRP